jgi:predicted amidohydrolase YtcJ
VFTGGWIFTGDEPEPRRGGLAVRDGRILTRDAARIADLSEDPRTRKVDLDGRLLVPGFQDAHVHPVMAGIELLGCDLTGCADAAEVLTAIAA